MKWSELPQEYRDLEKGFSDECNVKQKFDDLVLRFLWYKTPQGGVFWNKCDEAKSIKELPKMKGLV